MRPDKRLRGLTMRSCARAVDESGQRRIQGDLTADRRGAVGHLEWRVIDVQLNDVVGARLQSDGAQSESEALPPGAVPHAACRRPRVDR
jgi:hypothetical protein